MSALNRVWEDYEPLHAICTQARRILSLTSAQEGVWDMGALDNRQQEVTPEGQRTHSRLLDVSREQTERAGGLREPITRDDQRDRLKSFKAAADAFHDKPGFENLVALQTQVKEVMRSLTRRSVRLA
jgi:hypothetical protein